MRSVFLFLLVLIVVLALGGWVWQRRRAAIHQRRREAWHAKREEEDRIWYETMGDTPPSMPLGKRQTAPGDDPPGDR